MSDSPLINYSTRSYVVLICLSKLVAEEGFFFFNSEGQSTVLFTNTTCFHDVASHIPSWQTECSLIECFLAHGYVSVSNDGVLAVQGITGYSKKIEAFLS